DGVKAELERGDYPSDCIENYVNLLSGFLAAPDHIDYCRSILADGPGAEALDGLAQIIDGVTTLSSGTHSPDFDLSLVRGMGYYTGAIFEITSADFAEASIAGGGRYDKMIGQYTGKDVEACGFSIGFERIVRALMEKDAAAGTAEARIAVLYPKDASPADVALLQRTCLSARHRGVTVSVLRANKNARHQKTRLEEEGYTQFISLETPEDVKGFSEASILSLIEPTSENEQMSR
ncbi:MAG: ATP phosphoribosyltransferase regulatory subunit, partial [Coriobacteriales bacterium]|nr:ATP phosphoribosyltransferase regulatory subunit [Coriobacteriales bacterium]